MDNTALNLGEKNSIMIQVLANNKNIFIHGCPCQIIHNTANKAAERFSEVSGFDIADFFVDCELQKKVYFKFSTPNYRFSTLSFKHFLFFINQLQ